MRNPVGKREVERLKRVGRPAMRVRIVGPSRVSYIRIAISMRANPGVKTGKDWMRDMSTPPRHHSRVDHPVQAFVIPNTKRNERRRYKNEPIHVMMHVNSLVNNLLPI
jgi:hypothetical protein